MSTKDLRASFREKLSSRMEKRGNDEIKKADPEHVIGECKCKSELLDYKQKFAELNDSIQALFDNFKLLVMIEVQK